MTGDILSCALRELRRKKLRSLAVAFSYLITVAVMLLTANLLLFSRYAENEVLAATGTHFVTYLPNCGDITTLSEQEVAELARGIIPAKCQELCKNCTGCNKKAIDILNEGFMINTNTTRLVTLELVDRIRRLATVADASGYLLFRFRDPKSGRLFAVGGFDPKSTAVATTCCSHSDLIAGAFLGSDSSGQVMLEQGYAANLGLKPGDQVVIASESFAVAGIINPGVRPGRADVYMLFADAERVINRRIRNPLFQEANIILIEAASSKLHEQAMQDVKGLVQSDALVSYGCYVPASQALGLNEKTIWLFLALVGGAAALFAAKTQISSVIERRRQLAVLKAVGWKNSVVIAQVLAEALLLAASGCIAGALIAWGALQVLPVTSLLGISADVPLILNWQLLLAIVVFAVSSGSFAGLLPAIMVVRQNPAEVLRRIQ
jgi:putative ABC transport system permease protein